MPKSPKKKGSSNVTDVIGMSAPDDPGLPGGNTRVTPPTQDPAVTALETAEGMPQPAQPYELKEPQLIGGMSTPDHPGVAREVPEQDPDMRRRELLHGMGAPPSGAVAALAIDADKIQVIKAKPDDGSSED